MLPDSSPRNFFISLLSGMALFCSAAASAADEQETRWYDVEVIIFSQNNQQYRDSEMWPPDYDLPQQEAAQELLPIPAEPPTEPVPFTRLDPQSLRLSAEAERIKAAPDTELLLHLGWRQPGLAEEKAVAVRVDEGMQEQQPSGQPQAMTDGATDATLPLEGETPPHRMEGTLKLVLSRYLHIYTDLIYREPLSETGMTQTVAPLQSEIDLFALADDPFSLSMQPRYQVYHLKQSRRMRSREMHYLDHPVFGMAILVTPYEVKAAESEPTSGQ